MDCWKIKHLAKILIKNNIYFVCKFSFSNHDTPESNIFLPTDLESLRLNSIAHSFVKAVLSDAHSPLTFGFTPNGPYEKISVCL